MFKRNLAAVAAIVLALGVTGLTGCASRSTVPTSTAAPEVFDLDAVHERELESLERDRAAQAELDEAAAKAEAERVAAEQAAAEQAEAERQAAEQQAQEQQPVQQRQTTQQQQQPVEQPAPAPAPAPAPEPVRCPAGSSATESDGFNDTACMRSTANNGGSCWEGDNGMLPECQAFRP